MVAHHESHSKTDARAPVALSLKPVPDGLTKHASRTHRDAPTRILHQLRPWKMAGSERIFRPADYEDMPSDQDVSLRLEINFLE